MNMCCYVNKMKRIVVGIIDTGLDTKCKYFMNGEV